MSKSWPKSPGGRWSTRRHHTFPSDTGSASKDTTTRFTPHLCPSVSCPKVVSTLKAESSMSSNSDGRVPSTKRKRTPEMDLDSAPTEPRKASSPKKKKFKTDRPTFGDEDWGPATPKNPFPEEMEKCPQGSSDDNNGESSHYVTCQTHNSSGTVAPMEDVQESYTKLELEEDPRNYNVKPEVVQEFFTKYEIVKQLEMGGFAIVFAGERREDKRPVAMKVIRKENVIFWTEVVNGQQKVKTPLEVFLLCRAGAGPHSAGSAITPLLLGWYDVGPEVILVFERPDPCMDLLNFLRFYHQKGLNCQIAKVIFRQLVEAAIEMQARGIFHKDIKPENILIEHDDVIPRARFIDFGSGTTFLPGATFAGPQGTVAYSSPEWFRGDQYTAEPTTVWQMGLVLYVMLYRKLPLKLEETIGSFREVPIPNTCPEELRNLLKGCLDKDPETRLTLDNVINHPWLNM